MSPNFPSELEGPVQPDELFGYGNLINLIDGWTVRMYTGWRCVVKTHG